MYIAFTILVSSKSFFFFFVFQFMDFDPEKHEINELTLLEKHKLVLPNGDTKIGIWFE